MVSNSAFSRLAISNTTFFSRTPPRPSAPGSLPPWPGSMATIMSRNGACGAGVSAFDCTGTATGSDFDVGAAGDAFAGALAIVLSRSTTSRAGRPSSACNVKALEGMSPVRSNTRRTPSPRLAARTLAIRASSNSNSAGGSRVEVSRKSMTNRSGELRWNFRYATTSLVSSTSRVLSSLVTARTFSTLT